MKVKASAPGKLMLFGEHAVVYNYPCIVTTVSPRVYVEIEKASHPLKIIAPNVKNVHFIEETIRKFRTQYGVSNQLLIKTSSDFSSQYGFGSSSAVTVATIVALCKLTGVTMSNQDIFDLGYQVTLSVQGVGSGFDVAAAIYGQTLYFVTGGKVIEPLSIQALPLVIGYSGVKASTPTMVKNLKADFKIFEQIKKLVEEAKKNLLRDNYEYLGKLMTDNQRLLRQLGVSTEKLDQMCAAAVDGGAYGAKLSGAGGGDCMIALVPQDKIKQVEILITKVGGEIIRVKNNTQGVQLERT